MSDLPQIPGHRLIRALEKAGFIIIRQRGSHTLLRHREDLSRRATVILHGAHLTVEELKQLL